MKTGSSARPKHKKSLLKVGLPGALLALVLAFAGLILFNPNPVITVFGQELPIPLHASRFASYARDTFHLDTIFVNDGLIDSAIEAVFGDNDPPPALSNGPLETATYDPRNEQDGGGYLPGDYAYPPPADATLALTATEAQELTETAQPTGTLALTETEENTASPAVTKTRMATATRRPTRTATLPPATATRYPTAIPTRAPTRAPTKPPSNPGYPPAPTSAPAPTNPPAPTAAPTSPPSNPGYPPPAPVEPTAAPPPVNPYP